MTPAIPKFSDKNKHKIREFPDSVASNSYDSAGTLTTVLPRESIDVGPEQDFGKDLAKFAKFLKPKDDPRDQAKALRVADDTPNYRPGPVAQPMYEHLTPLFGTINQSMYGNPGYSNPGLTLSGGANNNVAMGWTSTPELYAGPQNAVAPQAGASLFPKDGEMMTPASVSAAAAAPSAPIPDPEEERRRQIRLSMGFLS